MITRPLLFSASILLGATTGVIAQTSGSAGNGMASPIQSPANPQASAADQNPRTPGATGNAVVPGNNSTMTGNRGATIEQRTGQGPSGGK